MNAPARQTSVVIPGVVIDVFRIALVLSFECAGVSFFLEGDEGAVVMLILCCAWRACILCHYNTQEDMVCKVHDGSDN